MRHEFLSQSPVGIDPGPPNTVSSKIVVADLAAATVDSVEVVVNINHTWNNDLVLTLVSPDGTEVVLADRVGGSNDDFLGTTFRDTAQTAIADGQAPFRGTFRPHGSLSELTGDRAEGEWQLLVEDTAQHDGGFINQWVLGLTTSESASSPFKIEVRFLGGLSPNQQLAFTSAATRWSEIIIGDLPPALLNGELIDDVLIEAQGTPIDGVGYVLGQAGPQFIRPGTNLPIKGTMSFDTADLDRMESEGSLEDVILHEMAHVLGFGTLWNHMDLIVNSGSVDPTFVGANAMREYGLLRGHAGETDGPTPVPVANTGGPGTRDGHWREAVLGDELLTGFITGSVRAISKMSIASFEDMGYQVDFAAADDYILPSMLRIAEIGLFGLRQPMDTCSIERTEIVVVPPSAIVNSM